MPLPAGVGFRVGGDSGINYLILQVHYENASAYDPQPGGELGFELTLVPQSSGLVTKSAAMLFVRTEGEIGPGAWQNWDAGCLLNESLVIHPFAFRVHTHALGRLGSVWKVEGGSGAQERKWSLIGKRDPQLPQGYYPVADPSVSLSAGDVIATRCLLHNNRTSAVQTGYV